MVSGQNIGAVGYMFSDKAAFELHKTLTRKLRVRKASGVYQCVMGTFDAIRVQIPDEQNPTHPFDVVRCAELLSLYAVAWAAMMSR